MPHDLKTLTPNLVVADVERSVAFYRDRLGFSVTMTVPDKSPYVFAMLRSGTTEIFVNAPGAAFDEYPVLQDRPIGGTLTLFFQVTGVRASYEALKDQVTVVMPIETKWYGQTEFAFLDPDGYLITFAERTS
jgi:catechol 2,3-dioxygenase-like lactoylglutathione lyase family enzyme